MRTILASLLILIMAVPAAQATTSVANPQDREYLRQSHENNLTEIISGEMAETQGECPRVRELGAVLVQHHSVLDAEVTTLAARHAVPLPESPSPEQLLELSVLSTRSGRDFDIDWLRLQISTHVRALVLGEMEMRYGQSPDVKELAAKSAPILQHHLDEATAAMQTCTAAP
jgi:putative membrane protein